MFELVVFDWDGTLMDSRARIVHAMGEACRALALPVPAAAAVHAVIGLDLVEAARRLLPGSDAATAAALAARYRLEYVAAQGVPEPLYPDAEATLDTLRGKGCLLAVATGKSRRGLDRALAESGLAPFFDATRSADECAAKPAPDMLLELMEELDVAAAVTLMVGDTTFDLEMARAAGVSAAALTHGAHPRQELAARRPRWLLDALGELPATLAGPQARPGGQEDST